MKFLKCLMAFKGRNYTSDSVFTENQNMVLSWVMRPGDYFVLNQMNYMGYHHKNESTYNTPAYRNGNYVKGDFFSRVVDSDYYTDNNQHFTNQCLWKIECDTDDYADPNSDVFLKIRMATDATVPIVRVDHGRPSDRIHALESLIERANYGDWDGVDGQPVPDYQYNNNNGIIRTPKLFYHKTDMLGTGAAIPVRVTGNPALRVGPHLYSGAGTEMAQSLIDLEKRIGIFLGSVGCTINILNPSGSEITSNYHKANQYCFTYPNWVPWCGGMMATPPPTQGSSWESSYYSDEVLTLVRGAGKFGSYGISGNLVCDNKNNLSGWCIPQAREQSNNYSSNTTSFDSAYGNQYKAGLFNENGNFKYIMTSIMAISGIVTFNASQVLTGPRDYNINIPDIFCIPAGCIVDSYQTFEHHKKMRYGTVVNNAWDTRTDGTVTTVFLGDQNNAFSLRDIQPGTPTGASSVSMGTWGSFGVLISTYETASGSTNIANATQIFDPITCLITPSIISDFPALDIYGIKKRLIEHEHDSGENRSYIQSESCFNYKLKSEADTGPILPDNPSQNSDTIEYVKIFKTIATSHPDIIEEVTI